MKKHFILLLALACAASSAIFTSCGDDDEPQPEIPTAQTTPFKLSGTTYYSRSSGELDNVASEHRMQLRFSLYKKENASSQSDLEPQAVVRLELQPFNVMSAMEGTKAAVLVSNGTWVEEYGNKLVIKPIEDTTNSVYFTPSPAEVTFLGYNTQHKKASFKINLTMANSTGNVKLEGTVDCTYEHNSYSIALWAGGLEN